MAETTINTLKSRFFLLFYNTELDCISQPSWKLDVAMRDPASAILTEVIPVSAHEKHSYVLLSVCFLLQLVETEMTPRVTLKDRLV